MLRQRYEIFGAGIGAYRAFIMLLCALLAVGLQLVLSRTRFGAQLRAGVLPDARIMRPETAQILIERMRAQ